MLLVAAGLGIAAWTSAHAAGDDDVVTFHCGDLVVIGRLENLDYEYVPIENDLLTHGWITARVRGRGVLVGHAQGRVLPARYFEHTYRREDRDFVLVINRTGPYGNLVRSARLIDRGR